MPALEEVLVGCREGSYWHEERVATKYAGRCLGCRHQVFVKPSAWGLFADWDHDPRVVCEECEDREHIMDAVMGL